MRILITGVSGMLGSHLAMFLSEDHLIFGSGNSVVSLPINYKIFDLSSESYKELIDWSQPELIIHCAAITDGNYCQKYPQEAFNINGFSVQKFLDSTKNNVKIIYISTDAVFSLLTHMASENDFVSPENIYGKSKELGEFFLNKYSNRRYVIIRTTIVGLNINNSKEGFVEWIINSAKKNNEIGLFTDVLFTPISIWALSNEIKFLIKTDNINSETIHIGGELCTKYQFGKKLLKSLKLSTSLISKSLISDFKDRVKRSTDQSINSTYYSRKYKRSLPNLEQTILKLKEHYELN